MERVEVEAYSQDVNAWVIRTPGRQYPALVVQGDSFGHLCLLAQSILDRAHASRSDAELVDEATELRDALLGRLRHYEETLRIRGFSLPNDQTQSSK